MRIATRSRGLLVVLALVAGGPFVPACESQKDASTFGKPGPASSVVEGTVFFGPGPAAGIPVKIGVESRLTDAAGAFRFDGVGASYDLVVEDEPGSYVVLPTLAQRIVNVPVQRPEQGGAWTATLRGELEPPLAEGRALTVVMSGLGVRSASGPLDRLVVRYRPDYMTTARVHVIETDDAPPFAPPGRFRSYGDAEVVMSDGALVPFRVRMFPITDTREIEIAPAMPAGFALESAIVSYDLGGGVTQRPLVSVTSLPARVTVPRILGFFSARVSMRRGEETAASGSVLLGDDKPRFSFLVHAPARLRSPAADALVTESTELVVDSEGGVFEHELTPVAPGGGPRVRVVTDRLRVFVPWRSIGREPQMDAKYTWRVRRLGALRSVLDYGIGDLHRDAALSLSETRPVTMRVPPPDAGPPN